MSILLLSLAKLLICEMSTLLPTHIIHLSHTHNNMYNIPCIYVTTDTTYVHACVCVCVCV